MDSRDWLIVIGAVIFFVVMAGSLVAGWNSCWWVLDQCPPFPPFAGG